MSDVYILQVIDGFMYGGGIQAYLMNYYMHINRDNLKFDFVVHGKVDAQIRREIESRGGRIYILPPFSIANLPKIVRETKELFQLERKYDAIHCHMANAAFLYFPMAKKYGIK